MLKKGMFFVVFCNDKLIDNSRKLQTLCLVFVLNLEGVLTMQWDFLMNIYLCTCYVVKRATNADLVDGNLYKYKWNKTKS